MALRSLFLSLVSLAAVAVSLQGCTPDDTDDAPGTLTLSADFTFGGDSVLVGRTALDAHADRLRLETFALYLGGIELLTDTGAVRLSDAERWDAGEDNVGPTMSAPVCTRAFASTLACLQNSTPTPTPPSGPTTTPSACRAAPVMFWSWNTGTSSKFDGKADTTGGNDFTHPFAFHIGGDANLIEVRLDDPWDGTPAAAYDFSLAGDILDFLSEADDPIDVAIDNVTHTGDNPALAARYVQGQRNTVTLTRLIEESTSSLRVMRVSSRLLTPIATASLLLLVVVLVGACRPDPTACTTPTWGHAAGHQHPALLPADGHSTGQPDHGRGSWLGRLLFWEKALSADSTMSCGTCHMPAFSFAEPTAVSTGITGAQGTRNAMALVNMGWATRFFWDGRAATLEEQVLEPIPHPGRDEPPVAGRHSAPRVRHGLCEAVHRRLRLPRHHRRRGVQGRGAVPPHHGVRRQQIRPLAPRAGPTHRPRVPGLRNLQPRRGDPEVVPGGQFGADCFHCHGEAGLQFTDYLFHNNGLDAQFSADPGLAGVTGQALDSGRFRTPTLRNVALSAPYMHDGRMQTLDEVIDHYNSGGVPSSTIDPFMKYSSGGLMLQAPQKEALLAFLHTLTDSAFVTNPAFADPH